MTLESPETMIFVLEQLITLEKSRDKYFPNYDISKYDWTNDLFDRSISFTEFSLVSSRYFAFNFVHFQLFIKKKNLLKCYCNTYSDCRLSGGFFFSLNKFLFLQ